MAFTTGTRIGPYKVAALIGKGGMGEVYRATDTNLGRDVAVKILPDAVADDPDRLMRFEREARTLASLNDPHIAHIYGCEKAGRTHALVMELVDGPTLADRIAQGPLPVDEALGIARQIAEALEAAHEQGIVHRDLKPANVKVRPDGAVKVLDFGLAKVLEPSSSIATDATASPTITSPATMPGVGLLGTAAYMSPEQARGRPVDKRSDIWAFGCVLYEMLTGRRAFGGDTTTEVIARILERDPDLTGLPPTTPAPVVRLLRRCLEKDARRRLRDIGEARFELEESKAGSNAAIASHPASSPASVAARPRRRLIVALCTLVLGAAVGTAAMWLSRRAPSSDQRPTSTFAITLPQDQKFTLPTRQMIALSPRGTHLAYVANSRLYLRALDQLSATPIQGTEGTTDVGALFFSPDGQWIGFWQGGELKKISLAGGAPIKICDSPLYAGASWGADDTIVFGRGGAGIWRVSGQGGTPERIIAVDEEKGYIAHGPQM